MFENWTTSTREYVKYSLEHDDVYLFFISIM